MTTRSASSAAATLASAAPPPGVSSARPQKRHRSSNTPTSDRKDLKEEDGEEDRAIHNATDTKKRRSELFEEDDARAAAAAEATRTTTTGPSALISTSTNGIVRPQGKGRSNKWDLTPVSLLLRTLGYMDNDALMIMCLVCKQIRDLIWTGQGMENKLVRIFELSSSKNNVFGDDFGYGRSPVRRFISKMNQYFENISKTRILQGFQHWKVQSVEEFHRSLNYDCIDDDILERMTQNIRMTGIVSLDMSLPSCFMQPASSTLYCAILFMVPNLQELDLSHTRVHPFILRLLADRCPRLEKIRWNVSTKTAIDVGGYELQSLNNLKEVYLDNWYFEFDHGATYPSITDRRHHGMRIYDVTEIEAMADSNNYPNTFLFHKLNSNPLERISIRNARYVDVDGNHYTIPQNILMKFVRKAPATLVWFRSDLSATNIHILQSERPGIQFLN